MNSAITTLLIFASIFAIAGIVTWAILPERRHRRPGTAKGETVKKLWKRIIQILKARWLCITEQCDYFEHYLAYGPAELTHEGYHAACRKCDEYQKKDADWLAEHPFSFESPFTQQCEAWEKRVRA